MSVCYQEHISVCISLETSTCSGMESQRKEIKFPLPTGFQSFLNNSWNRNDGKPRTKAGVETETAKSECLWDWSRQMQCKLNTERSLSFTTDGGQCLSGASLAGNRGWYRCCWLTSYPEKENATGNTWPEWKKALRRQPCAAFRGLLCASLMNLSRWWNRLGFGVFPSVSLVWLRRKFGISNMCNLVNDFLFVWESYTSPTVDEEWVAGDGIDRRNDEWNANQ